MQTNYLKKTFIFFLGAVFLSSCLKIDEDLKKSDNFDQVLKEASTSEISNSLLHELDDLISDFNNGASKVRGMKKTIGIPDVPCVIPTVTRLSPAGVYPAKYVICLDPDSAWDAYASSGKEGWWKLKFGDIYVTVTDKQGSFVEYKSDNYSESYWGSSKKINFTRVHKSNGEGVLNISATERTEYTSGELSGKVSEKTWVKTRTLIGENRDKSDWRNFSYSFEGESYGTTINGDSYYSTITKPLIISEGYRYFVSGEVKTETEKGFKYIDYGNGVKDNLATIDYNGNVYTIQLNWE
jgi:hypothetical protein